MKRLTVGRNAFGVAVAALFAVLAQFAFAVEKPTPPNPPDAKLLGEIGDVPTMDPEAKLVAGWKEIGEKFLPVRFAAGDNERRVAYDFPIRLSLATNELLALDIAVTSSKMSSFIVYLRSGNGWYHHRQNLCNGSAGHWTHLEFSRKTFERIEGKPSGWDKIDCLRIAFYRPLAGAAFSGAAMLANLSKRPMRSASSAESKRFAAEVAAFGKAADAWARSLDGKLGERRLMWCHSPLGMNRDGDWDTSVKMLKSVGYTDLIANLAWGCGADYRSKVVASTPTVEQHGDMLEKSLAACRKYGVRLHVWNVCWPMSRALKDKAKIGADLDRQGRLQYDVQGKRVRTNNTDWLCPSSPENRKMIAAMMIELAEKGVDGVHFDYIRYPGEGSCYCTKCRERFEAKIGARCAAWPKDVLDGGVRRDDWVEFRKTNITALVREVGEVVHAKFPKVEVSAAVFRDPERDPISVGQDWPNWLKAGYVDFVCPMDYTWDIGNYSRILENQKAHVGLKGVYPGIGLTSSARFPQDGGDAYRFSEQVLEVRKLGFAGFTCFNFDPRCVAAMKVAREGVLKAPSSVDSDEIDRRIAAACADGSRKVTLTRNAASSDGTWWLTRAILLPDDFTLILDGCRLEQVWMTQDNLIRNAGAKEGDCKPNRGIRILGRNGATLSMGRRNNYAPKRSGDHNGWRSVGILLCDVSDYEIGGLAFGETQCWAISQERCHHGRVHDIVFGSTNLLYNQDGVDLRKGCHDIVVENITGSTGDDAVALTAYRDAKGSAPRYGMQIGGNAWLDEADDVYNVTIRRVHAKCAGGHGIVRLLACDGIKMHHIEIDDVVDTASGKDKRPKAAIRIGDVRYHKVRHCQMGEMHHVTVRNVRASGKAAVWLKGPLCDSEIVNITPAPGGRRYDITAPYERVKFDPQ